MTEAFDLVADEKDGLRALKKENSAVPEA